MPVNSQSSGAGERRNDASAADSADPALPEVHLPFFAEMLPVSADLFLICSHCDHAVWCHQGHDPCPFQTAAVPSMGKGRY